MAHSLPLVRFLRSGRRLRPVREICSIVLGMRNAPNRRTFIIAALVVGGGLLLFGAVRYLTSTASIEIVAAEYGVLGRTCTAAVEVMRRATDACGGFRPRCLVSVSSGWCGDPAPGVVKTLTVEYLCGATRKRASAADGTPLVLTCP